MVETDKCFVVMPFGIKPRNDGTDRVYNFDKVYRVIIQRAISNVNMKPLRADETEGSRIVHADMFKDLRDRPVVLVDLSLLNPNVLYELGIRHVMSSTGTVLIANEETVKKLPFDIALSRTIAYRYDGEHLDWDEVERVIPQLQAAIEEARRGTPDSPVYAFLEQVLSPGSLKKDEQFSDVGKDSNSELDDYQEQFAKMWLEKKDLTLNKLIEKHSNSVFGVRAIGHYGLLGNMEKPEQTKIALFLYNHEQYDLSKKLYQQFEKDGTLEFSDYLFYASAVSETYPGIDSALKGLNLLEKARAMAKKRMDDQPNNVEGKKDYSYATQHVAAMKSWIWSITRDDDDLKDVISELRKSIDLIEELRLKGCADDIPMSRYAQNLIRHTMFLRIYENDPDRMDVEKNFQKIVSLKPGNKLSLSDSYLRWYQAFILADMGKYDDAQKRAQAAITLDIRYAAKDEETAVGRRQYSELRRLLEDFSRFWRDPKSIARVSQIINSATFN
jgi:hypothetical protein